MVSSEGTVAVGDTASFGDELPFDDAASPEMATRRVYSPLASWRGESKLPTLVYERRTMFGLSQRGE